MAKKNSKNHKKTTTKRRPANSARKIQNKKSPANPLTREITFLIIIVFSILALLSVFHVCGPFGEVLSHLLFGLFGIMAYIFPFYIFVCSGLLLANKSPKTHAKVYYSMGLYLGLCGLIQWMVNDPVANVWEVYNVCAAGQRGGGFLGGLLAVELARVLGRAGSCIVILAVIVLFFMLISQKLLFSALRQLYADSATRRDYVDYEEYSYEPEPAEKRKPVIPYSFKDNESVKEEKQKNNSKKAKKEESTKKRKKALKPEEVLLENVVPEVEPIPEEIHIHRGSAPDTDKESTVYQEELDHKFGTKKAVQPEKPPTEPVKEKVKITKEDEPELKKVQKELDQAAATQIPYQFPSLDLLAKPKNTGKSMGNDELRATALKLQNTLQSFGVRVKLGDISLGPSVTQYELIPEQGVKVSKITSLADDIKLSLAASDIRIEAPIPGKAAVGIEVPNPHRSMVTLRELLESNEFKKQSSKVTFAVGKDISGNTIVTDIAKMPHLLIAGATGSGKSVLVNTLIMSIIYKATPNEVKLIMIDPKMVELAAYEEIPHLMIPVVKDPKKASAALAWAVAEMTSRYQKFADAGVRDIKSYNARIEQVKDNTDPEYQKLPQIVIIVDEFADLMMVAPGEVEDAVCRLAQLARAAGIHLVLATQRPSVNVITGLIKANIPSRIALSVSSQVDSRTIIDSAGAEKLLGNGDMLFAPQDYPKPKRVQGAFVSDEERDRVVSFLKEHSNGPSYNDDVTKHIETMPVAAAGSGNAGAAGANENDELFVEAGFFIIDKDKASIGLLQRMFRIGFNRAARIMDQLADAGVVGPEEGTKARQILMSREQFENYLEENG